MGNTLNFIVYCPLVLYSLLPHQGGNGLFLDNNPIGLNPAIIPTAEIEGGRCPLGYFVCDDNRAQCVPQRWICNGLAECEDKSDEIGCGITFHDKTYSDFSFLHKAVKEDEPKDEEHGLTARHLPPCKYRPDHVSPQIGSIFPRDLLTSVGAKCHCFLEKFFCNGVQQLNLGIVPADVEYLDLSGTIIDRMPSGLSFPFPQLEHLVLSECAIPEISVGTFHRLRNLKTLHLTGNLLKEIRSGCFSANAKLEKLLLGYNQISELGENSFEGLTLLEELDLRNNRLNGTEHGGYKYLQNLRILHLSGNRIKEVGDRYFEGLGNLEILSLSHNMIFTIQPNAFNYSPRLRSLYLSWNQLELLKSYAFRHLHSLVDLHLNDNRIRGIQDEAFSGLSSLQSLNLKRNMLKGTQDMTHIFVNLTNLQYVYFDELWMCAWTLHVRHCQPHTDGISSVQNLLDNFLLRVCVWIIGVVGVLGNLFVIVSRSVFHEIKPIHSFYIKNLAVADLFIGIFLISIGFHDIKFRGQFLMFQHTWRLSLTCQFSGFMSTWSSEASVLILALITLDRYLSVVRPFAEKSTSKSIAFGLLSFIWLFSFLLAFLPLSGLFDGYFEHFYSSNGLCVPLQIHNPYDTGWEYSLALFVILNTVVFSFILYAYGKMLRVIRASGLSLRTNQENHDGILAIRFSLVVLTDFLCWGPVILAKVLAMTGIPIPADLYAWLAVFVLPVNSMLNPIIYTMTTQLFREQMVKFKRRWILAKPRRHTPLEPTASTSAFAKGRTHRGTIEIVFPSPQARRQLDLAQNPLLGDAGPLPTSDLPQTCNINRKVSMTGNSKSTP